MDTTPTLLRLERVIDRRGRSRSQTYIDIRAGRFPPPVHVGDRGLSVWPAAEVDAVLRAEIAGATQDQLRELVRALVARRGASQPQQAA